MGSQARLFYSTRTPQTRALSAALGAHRYKGPATKIGKGFGTLSASLSILSALLRRELGLGLGHRYPYSTAHGPHRHALYPQRSQPTDTSFESARSPTKKIGKGFGMPLGFVKFSDCTAPVGVGGNVGPQMPLFYSARSPRTRA